MELADHRRHGPRLPLRAGARSNHTAAANDVTGTRAKHDVTRRCDENKGTKIFGRSVRNRQVVPAQIHERVSGWTALAIADRTCGDMNIAAIVSHLPIVGVTAEDSVNGTGLNDASPFVDAWTRIVLPYSPIRFLRSMIGSLE
jgi:hypothetical protein